MPKPPRLQPSKAAAADNRKPMSGLAAAGNVVACVGVGGLIGFGLDKLLGTLPWGLLIGLFLGFGAWLRELWLLLKSSSPKG